MISSLSISNYALIRQLNIEPEKGLNIITGETGAGKSIMLGAVGLLLGKRADTKALLDKSVKCIIEGVFELGQLKLHSLFEELDLDHEDQSIIRREINPNGKSRAFVNDVPVTLDVLQTVGLRLIDIHSQNESLQLADKHVKIKLIDDYSQTGKQLLKYQLAFKNFTSIQSELEEMLARKKESGQEADYKKFLLDELSKAELNADEQANLEEELKILENAEEIKLKLSGITNEFEASDVSFNDKLREVSATLKKLAQFSKNMETLANRFDVATEEIMDVIRDLSYEQERIEHDPGRIDTVNQRLDLIYKLQQKHQVQDVQSLLDIQTQLENESTGVLNLEDTIEKLKKQSEKSQKEMIAEAEKLSENRRKHIDIFSTSLNSLLKEVGMPDGRVELAYKRVQPWKMGIDEIEVLFSANKGINPEPVGKVASGGEFSRLMFCVKFLLADKTTMPTVIFDEIDTGVSGEIAIKLAAMMKKMAANHQIIAISHLPQVAAKGNAHYYVYKDSNSSTTESLIRKLEEPARLEEIAKMIGGDSPSETSINSARELITKN